MLSVLVVDDEKAVLDATRGFLERFGNMNVQTALSAKEALQILMDQTFDAMVVDYSMPDINGIGLLKIIRSEGNTTPVILFTGVGRELAAIEALNNGADFFLKKGDTAESPFREMVHMIRQSVDQRYLGRAPGTARKLLADTLRFFPDPSYAIDREGKIIAWNQAMAEISGIEAKAMLGKGDRDYAVPFFGRKAPMLTDLIFENDATIAQNGYVIVSREEGTIIAWTRVPGTAGTRLIWMKAAPLHDAKGLFIGVIGAVKDITDELGEELLDRDLPSAGGVPPVTAPAPHTGSRFDRLFGKAKSLHRTGVDLFRGGQNYPAALHHFEQALEIDPSLASAWYYRALCLRELSRDDESLMSFDRAVERAPENEEFLLGRAGMLKKIGILRGQKSTVEAAGRAFLRLVESNPDHARALHGLACCMKGTGNDRTARRFFDRAQEMMHRGANTPETEEPRFTGLT